MTAADFADLIGARLVRGRGWIGPCPSHQDPCAGIIITKGYMDTAKVECVGGCSINKILKALGLTWREFESWPAPTPNLLDVDDAERKAFKAQQLERQSQHAAICEEIRTLQKKVRNIRRAIGIYSPDELPQ